ncbi:tetraspanin-8-like isoform X2 [Triticum dicoccoides]|uniref:tetraspanin-8-like isoform X2 n=1 Tax=Triticum dicoccoides TaxID=85692 RepID=UPI001890FE01|nr:tetraspanin-8-like isoform X2 [Triticum dicoccoides]
MVRLSNTVIGILNAVTFLLSVPILAGGIWLRARADGTECERYLAAPVIAVGVFLMLVSIAGLVGACCRVTCLLWFYLVAMFLLIVVLLGLTVFAFVVTHKGTGEAVSGRGFKEYRLGDYSNWLQKRVENDKNWNRIKGCLQDAKVCKSLEDKTVDQFMSSDLSPIQSTEPDCGAWSNDGALCYGCQSCKAGVVATLKRNWKRSAIINIVFLVFIIIVYSVGCCAFRNNRRDHRNGGGYKQQGAYA